MSTPKIIPKLYNSISNTQKLIRFKCWSFLLPTLCLDACAIRKRSQQVIANSTMPARYCNLLRKNTKQCRQRKLHYTTKEFLHTFLIFFIFFFIQFFVFVKRSLGTVNLINWQPDSTLVLVCLRKCKCVCVCVCIPLYTALSFFILLASVFSLFAPSINYFPHAHAQ